MYEAARRVADALKLLVGDVVEKNVFKNMRRYKKIQRKFLFINLNLVLPVMPLLPPLT